MGHAKTRLKLPAQCLNCSAVLTGAYCSQCGQSASVGVPTLGELFHDMFESFTHMDSRLWTSVRLLLLSPGLLSQHYVAGQRTSSLPPIRLYLVCSFLFFLMVTLLPANESGLNISVYDKDTGSNVTLTGEGIKQCGIDEKAISKLPFKAQLLKACEVYAQSNGKALNQRFWHFLPVLMMALVVVMAGLLKLMYAGSGHRYVENTVFLLHVHAAFFLLMSLNSLLQALVIVSTSVRWPAAMVGLLVLLYLLYYLGQALRSCYGGGAVLNVAKTALMLVGYAIGLVVVWVLGFVLTVLLL